VVLRANCRSFHEARKLDVASLDLDSPLAGAGKAGFYY
jgi:hypothetical protein